MRKKLLLLALVGLMLTGCGSDPVEKPGVAELKVPDEPLKVLEVPPENAVVKEEEPQIIFTEECKEHFAKRIEKVTGTTAECLGIEFGFDLRDTWYLLFDKSFPQQRVAFTYAYFLLNNTEIVRVREDNLLHFGEEIFEQDNTKLKRYEHVTDFKSVDEFREAALADPFIVILDKNSSPLFVDMEEITDYVEIMEPILNEFIELGLFDDIRDWVGCPVEVEDSKCKEIVEQTVSYFSPLLLTALGEEYKLLGYKRTFTESATEMGALVDAFVVEDAEGKIYLCSRMDGYAPMESWNIGAYPFKDKEEFLEEVKNFHAWRLYDSDILAEEEVLSTESEDIVVTEPTGSANDTQKDKNEREKTFAEVLADPNASVPSDEYILCGLFYDAYSTPDEIVRYEFIRDDSTITDSPSMPECYKYLYITKSSSLMETFERYVVLTTLSNYTVEGYVSGYYVSPYENVKAFTFRTSEGIMKAVLTQTSEDLAKGENVWSMYVAVDSLFFKDM